MSNKNSTLKRWYAGKYTSTHGFCPTQWREAWKNVSKGEKIEPTDFNLDSDGCLFTEKARDVFLKTAQELGTLEDWPKAILDQVGEVEGVFAWETPIQALRYSFGILQEEVAPPTIAKQKLDQNWIAMFEGDKLKTKNFDGLGSVVAKVIAPICLCKAEYFANKCNFKFEKADLQSGIELPFSYE